MASEADRVEGWVAIYYELDANCWGYLLEHEEHGVYAYDENGGRRVVPSFHRFEHAALFARQLPGQPEIAPGGWYELGSTLAFANGERADAPPELEDHGWLLKAVADAAGLGADLANPSDDAPSPHSLSASIQAFRNALRHLDRAPRSLPA